MRWMRDALVAIGFMTPYYEQRGLEFVTRALKPQEMT